MDITWLENSSSDDIFFFREGNRDTHNSPYTVIDKVDVGLGLGLGLGEMIKGDFASFARQTWTDSRGS